MTKELNFFQSEMETVSPDLLEDGPQENSPHGSRSTNNCKAI